MSSQTNFWGITFREAGGYDETPLPNELEEAWARAKELQCHKLKDMRYSPPRYYTATERRGRKKLGTLRRKVLNTTIPPHQWKWIHDQVDFDTTKSTVMERIIQEVMESRGYTEE